MTNKSIFFMTFLIVSYQCLLAMEQKEDSSPTRTPRAEATLELDEQAPQKEPGRKSPSIIVNLSMNGLAQTQPMHEASRKTHHKHPLSSTSSLRSIIIEPSTVQQPTHPTAKIPHSKSLITIEPDLIPSRSQSTEPISHNKSFITIDPVAMHPHIQSEEPPLHGIPLTFAIDTQDFANATPEELDKIVDELIRQASIATFASHDENAFYVPELKAALLQYLSEYIREQHNVQAAGSGSSSSSPSGSEGSPRIPSRRSNSIVEPKEEAIAKLRQGVLRRISPRKMLIARQPVEQSQATAAPSSSTNTEDSIHAHKDLKEWFFQELELHDLRMREQQRELQEKSAKDQEELDGANRKTKYAIAATIATTICGIATTLITYYTTHAMKNASE